MRGIYLRLSVSRRDSYTGSISASQAEEGGSIPLSRSRKGLLLKILMGFFVIGGLVVWSRFSNFHPTDSNLKYNFEKDRLGFSELLGQFKEDNLIDVLGTNSSRSYESGNNLEYKNYQQAMKKLGLIEVFNGMGNKDNIWFVVSSTPLNGRKGYAYITDPGYKKRMLFYTVNSTNNKRIFPRDGDGSSDTFYVPIVENWYIFYEEFGD